ncbi:MAG: PD-(D/E)XK nuclease family protein [Chromatiales bacterium]|nr:PD-(D/E)XK nuclease family protein [Chromatiales bacterium]
MNTAAYPALAALAPGVTVLTANKRLARALQRAYAARAQSAGHTVWETPDILPWPAWLQRSWDALMFSAPMNTNDAPQASFTLPSLLLNPLQEHVLWRSVLANSETVALLRPDAAARLVSDAYALCQSWRINPDRDIDASTLGRDAQAFLSWSREFEARCRTRNFLARARLPDVLASAFASGEIAVPAGLYLTGFDEITPQQHALLDTLAVAGTRIEIEPAPAAVSGATLHAYSDAEAEMIAAAHWARARLEAGVQRIAIVVPDLAACRTELTHILDDVLVPTAILPASGAPRALPYDLSLGFPLADYPVVHAALIALQMLDGNLTLAHAGALLRSPFIAGAETEISARGMFDAVLRQRGEATLAFETFVSLAGAAPGCALLGKALRQWQRIQRDLSSRLPPSAWVEHVLHLLHVLGWPGERTLDSNEYQTVQAWRELICSLAGLDTVRPLMERRELLSELRRISAERIYQPEREEAPLQVLGMLEAAGMRFDGLWILGMQEDAWPRAPDPNPFLPISLQRKSGLRCTPERMLEFARSLGARLESVAPEVRFSYALTEDDRALRPSALLTHLAPRDQTRSLQQRPLFYRELIQVVGRLETLEDSSAPQYIEREAPGGSRLFRLQALCPFRAFTELRLHAQPLQDASTGPDAAVRGKLLHRALELLWRELGDSEHLHALTADDGEALLGRCIDAVLQEAIAKRPAVYTATFCEVERWRLLRRLREWLDIERARAPFIVEQLEEKRSIAVDGLEVEVRLDRLDRLSDGRYAVIDYKTGAVNIDGWFSDRPEEPQLPLYALALGETIDALLFACLKPGDVGYVGVAQNMDIAPGKGVRPYEATPYAAEQGSWDAQRQEWSRVLSALAADFRAGRAEVDPKHYPQTCTHCALTALCRINELTGPVDDEATA